MQVESDLRAIPLESRALLEQSFRDVAKHGLGIGQILLVAIGLDRGGTEQALAPGLQGALGTPDRPVLLFVGELQAAWLRRSRPLGALGSLGACGATWAGVSRRFQQHRECLVPRMPPCLTEDLLRLEVSMYDALLMGALQSGANLSQDGFTTL